MEDERRLAVRVPGLTSVRCRRGANMAGTEHEQALPETWHWRVGRLGVVCVDMQM